MIVDSRVCPNIQNHFFHFLMWPVVNAEEVRWSKAINRMCIIQKINRVGFSHVKCSCIKCHAILLWTISEGGVNKSEGDLDRKITHWDSPAHADELASSEGDSVTFSDV